jgi:hypothetical protein
MAAIRADANRRTEDIFMLQMMGGNVMMISERMREMRQS